MRADDAAYEAYLEQERDRGRRFFHEAVDKLNQLHAGRDPRRMVAPLPDPKQAFADLRTIIDKSDKDMARARDEAEDRQRKPWGPGGFPGFGWFE